jgi:hypothetical protein
MSRPWQINYLVGPAIDVRLIDQGLCARGRELFRLDGTRPPLRELLNGRWGIADVEDCFAPGLTPRRRRRIPRTLSDRSHRRLLPALIVVQGLEDEIVPPDQTEMIVQALQSKGVPVASLPLENEQHRRAENIEPVAIEGFPTVHERRCMRRVGSRPRESRSRSKKRGRTPRSSLSLPGQLGLAGGRAQQLCGQACDRNGQYRGQDDDREVDQR